MRTPTDGRRGTLLLALCWIGLAPSAWAAVYDVGPGMPYTTIGAVPWATLAAGDTVRIHWRSDSYREKWVIARQGTALDPITVQGAPGPGGALPVIDGDGAVTPTALDYWSETRGIIKIGGSSVPADVMPRHIVIENLDITGARSPATFTDDNGSTRTYDDNASTIYVEKGESITVRNCILRDSGNGFFVASSDAQVSRDILFEGNSIHGNGNAGSIYEHNSYTAAIGITFQYNHFGPLCSGCGGNNLKDRSAATVVRYNWIEGGNRQLDLVAAEDSSQLRNDPAYGETFVYGNVLVEPDADGNRQVLHYGGDSGSASGYRKGTLYLHNNTVVSYRTDRTTLMRLSTNDETCEARNNIVYLPGANGDTLALLDENGTLDWSHNWVEPGWRDSFGSFQGTLEDDSTSIEGTDPGFDDAAGEDFRLAAGSACLDAGTSLPAAVLPEHDVLDQYVKHNGAEPRLDGGALDVGAYTEIPEPSGTLMLLAGAGLLGVLDRRRATARRE